MTFVNIDKGIRRSARLGQYLFFLGGGAAARTFSCTRVGMGALTARRQSLSMAQTPVTSYIHKALDAGADFAAQVAFNLVVLLKFLADLVNFLIGEIVYSASPIHTCGIKNFQSRSPTDAVNIGKGNISAFASGQIYSRDSGHVKLLLA
jgi:hypothetical protein